MYLDLYMYVYIQSSAFIEENAVPVSRSWERLCWPVTRSQDKQNLQAKQDEYITIA